MVAETAEITGASIGAMGDLFFCSKKPRESAFCGFAKSMPVQFRADKDMVQISPNPSEIICAPFVV